MKNDMLKSIIMEQIDTAEIFYGYKIDDKNSFCEEIISQIPEEYYEGIINEEMGEYIEDLIINTYKKDKKENNKKLISDKVLRLVETSLRVNYYSRWISVDKEKIHKLVMSLIPLEYYEAILNNEMNYYLEDLINFSFDRLYGEKIEKYKELDEQYSQIDHIFQQRDAKNNESQNEEDWQHVIKTLKEMNESKKSSSETIEKKSNVKDIETIVREYYDPKRREHYIKNYIRKILVKNHLSFDDLDQEVNKIMKEHFYNEKAYFHLRNGEYDVGIFEVGLADSNELKNIKKDVSDILLTKENKYRDRSEEEKEQAVTATATLLYSSVKNHFEVQNGKMKADDYVHKEIYHPEHSGISYYDFIVEILDEILRVEGKKNFGEIMRDLAKSFSETDWKTIVTGAGLLVLGAATDFVVPVALVATKISTNNANNYNKSNSGGRK